jgi:drug/metabolite transporter (DMT)-like permease
VPWLVIVLLGLFQLGVAYVLFSKGIKITPPITASLIAVLEPLLNPVWVLITTGERPGLFAVGGGVVVLITIVVYNVATVRQSRGRLPVKPSVAVVAVENAD